MHGLDVAAYGSYYRLAVSPAQRLPFSSAYDTYTNPSKNNVVFRTTLTMGALPT
jgi:hypothetical protein